MSAMSSPSLLLGGDEPRPPQLALVKPPRASPKPRRRRAVIESAHCEGRGANSRVVMTFADAADTEPTTDLSDRAHGVRDHADGLLVSARTLGSAATPRRYPSCYMIGPPAHRVSFESAIDDLVERRRWLEAQGLEVHGLESASAATDYAISRLESMHGCRAARSMLRG